MFFFIFSLLHHFSVSIDGLSKQRMHLRRKRIDDRDTAPGEAVLKVFAQRDAASLFRRNREHQSIPDLHLVVRMQIHRRLERRPGRVANVEYVGPCQYGVARLSCAATRPPRQHAAQFTQYLACQHHVTGGQSGEHVASGGASCRIAFTLGVDKDVRVDGHTEPQDFSHVLTNPGHDQAGCAFAILGTAASRLLVYGERG